MILHCQFPKKSTSPSRPSLELTSIEPLEPVYRVFGRSHYVINAPAESSDMVDYAQQTVDLYVSITGSQKLKHRGFGYPSAEVVKGK